MNSCCYFGYWRMNMRMMPDDIFFDMFNMNNDKVWQPKADVYETEKYVVVKVEAAGLNPENIEITLSNDNKTLNIKGIRNETDETDDEKIEYYQMQIYYGMFDTDIELPLNIYIDRNDISAKYKNGMLIVKLVKSKKNEPISIKIED